MRLPPGSARHRALGLVFALAALATTWTSAAPEAPREPSPGLVRSRGQANVRALEAALILSGQEGGAIRTALLTAPGRSTDGSPLLHLVVEVDGPALLGGLDASNPVVDVFLYIVGSEREVTASKSFRFRIDLERHGPLLRHSGLKVPTSLAMPPGESLLRVLVRTGSGVFGIRTLPLSVVGPESRSPGLHSPLFPDRTGNWLVGAPEGESAGGGWPLEVGDPPTLPACLPVVTHGRTATFFVPAFRADEDPPELTLQMVHTGHGTEARLRLPVLERIPRVGLATDLLEVELDTVDLESASLAGGATDIGTWAITLLPEPERVEVAAGTGRPSGFLVIVPEGAAVPWPRLDLDRIEDSSPSTVARHPGEGDPRPPELQAGGQGRKRTEREYRSSLFLLASGDPSRAEEAIGLLETAAAEAGGRHGLETVARIEEAILLDLRAAAADSLLPPLWLHTRLTERYLRDQRPALREHGVLLVQRLAAAYVEAAAGPAARADAAGALSSLGGALQRAGRLPVAEELFVAALELATDDETAMLGLAATQEKQGRYLDTVATLARLLESHPGHLEARLRLGVNLHRTSESATARRVLGQLAELDEPRWIVELAHQELARIALDLAQSGLAAEILRQGLDRWPESAELRIQLAHLRDVAGSPAEAWGLLRGLEDQPPGPIESPRLRYNHWPRRELAAARARLDTRSEESAESLRRALGEIDPEPGP